MKLSLPSDFSILDIAGGRGVVLNGIAGLFPQCKPTIIDIKKFDYDWRKHRKSIRQLEMPLQEFIKQDNSIYDVVMMLNSYRNWQKKKSTPKRTAAREAFDQWLISHAKYFITSGAILPYLQGEIRGHDYRDMLQLFILPLAKKDGTN